jgi:hypothetical protein
VSLRIHRAERRLRFGVEITRDTPEKTELLKLLQR